MFVNRYITTALAQRYKGGGGGREEGRREGGKREERGERGGREGEDLRELLFDFIERVSLMIAHDPFRHQFTCIYVSWLGNERAHLHIACVFACASEGTLQNILVQVHVCVCVGYGPTQNTCEHSILWRCACCCKQIADTHIQSALLYSSVR